MEWEDVSENTRDTMNMLGDFSPTVHAKKRELKGFIHDEDGGSKTYWDSDDLRQIATACIEAADWLDQRAKAIEE